MGKGCRRGAAWLGSIVDSKTVSCPDSGDVITGVAFADYGTASGSCGAFRTDTDCSFNCLETVEDLCVGKPSCTVEAPPSDPGAGSSCPAGDDPAWIAAALHPTVQTDIEEWAHGIFTI